MKKIRLLTLASLSLLIVFQSCRPTSKELVILYDKAFNEVKDLAEQDDKMFCLVLSRPSCPPCVGFIQSLGDRYRHLSSKVIFNVLDISLPENQWYPQWLCTGAFPTTCVFSSGGELQAVISGSTETCRQCIASSISGDAKCARYFENPQFPAHGETRISMLNTLLSCKQHLDEGEDISAEIRPFLDSPVYPYSLFLMCLNEEKQGRREESVYWAQRMLSIENPYYSFVYDALYKEAKSIINPDYASEASELSVVKELKLDGCKHKVSRPFSLTLANTGKSPLSIRDIGLSCSCLKLLSGKKHEIQPGQSVNIDFEFTPDVRGDVFREVTFFSDARNSLESVRISAVVK